MFKSRADMQEGAQIIQTIFGLFGLRIYIRKGELQSKTKFDFFPQTSWFILQNKLGSRSNATTTMMKDK